MVSLADLCSFSGASLGMIHDAATGLGWSWDVGGVLRRDVFAFKDKILTAKVAKNSAKVAKETNRTLQ